MIELAFVVCLRSAPDLCEDRNILYAPEVTLMGCMLQAQPELAAWAEGHPDRRVARWTCQWSEDAETRA